MQAIRTGIMLTGRKAQEGVNILAIGEMGIGNTTTSSAVASVLLKQPVAKMTGRGAGLTGSGLEHKKQVIEEAILKYDPDPQDAFEVLCKVGGLDIAAMAGTCIGGMVYGLPVVLDGFISAVAALAAVRINPLVREYLIPSHCSKEIGYNIAMRELNLEPMINLDMRLGEGSGCPIAFSIVEFSLAMMNNMATFDEAEINDDYLEEVRGEENYIV